MRLVYRISIEDLLAFHLYHYDHSPSQRRTKALISWLPALLFLFISFFLFSTHSAIEDAEVAEDADWVGMAIIFVFALGGLVWPFVIPRLIRRNLEKQVRALLREGSNRGIVGPHELELTDGHLVEKNSCGGTFRIYEAIDRVVVEEGYAFIYFTATSAHVVPIKAVEEGDFVGFMGELKHRMSTSGQPATPKDNPVSTAISKAPRGLPSGQTDLDR